SAPSAPSWAAAGPPDVVRTAKAARTRPETRRQRDERLRGGARRRRDVIESGCKAEESLPSSSQHTVNPNLRKPPPPEGFCGGPVGGHAGCNVGAKFGCKVGCR